MSPLRLIVALFALPVAVGCGGSGLDKVGGVRPGVVTTLTLANGNTELTDLRPWVDEVARLSKGRLRIRSLNRWRAGQPSYEAGLIRDVRAGRAQLGWAGTRAWDSVGVRSFDSLNAPFLVDSYALEGDVLRGSAGVSMLAGVARAQVQPIALLPGPMRLLLTRRPVTRPADLEGLEIGMQASEVGQRALRLLGARPMPVGAGMAGRDGVESQVGASFGNGYVTRAPYLTSDVPLWPRPLVVFANKTAWRALSDDQRAVLREAAARAFPLMLRNARGDDARGMAGLCHTGVRVVSAGTQGREALRHAVEPLYAELRRRTQTRASLVAIERMRAQSGPAEQLSCPPAPSPVGAGPLAGTYTTTFRRGERGADVIGNEFTGNGAKHIRFDLELRAGRAVITELFPDGHKITGFDETFKVYRDRITLGGESGPPLTARWELQGKKLRFSEISGGPDDRFVWGTHPWVRTSR